MKRHTFSIGTRKIMRTAICAMDGSSHWHRLWTDGGGITHKRPCVGFLRALWFLPFGGSRDA